jgi:hypothetical protein
MPGELLKAWGGGEVEIDCGCGCIEFTEYEKELESNNKRVSNRWSERERNNHISCTTREGK